MGNAIETVERELHREYRSGNLLLEAIRSNSRRLVKRSIMQARSDFLDFQINFQVEIPKPKIKEIMIHHLTREYDIGDGIIFTKTPSEYSKSIHADEALQAIVESLQAFQKSDLSLKHFDTEIEKHQNYLNLFASPPSIIRHHENKPEENDPSTNLWIRESLESFQKSTLKIKKKSSVSSPEGLLNPSSRMNQTNPNPGPQDGTGRFEKSPGQIAKERLILFNHNYQPSSSK